MHELPVINNILEIVLKHALNNKAEKVISITLIIGEMTDLEDEWMNRYFEYVSRDSMAEGAILKIERVPVIVRCRKCRHEFSVDIRNTEGITCDKCNTEKDFDIISGNEYYIKEMEIS